MSENSTDIMLVLLFAMHTTTTDKLFGKDFSFRATQVSHTKQRQGLVVLTLE